MDMDMDLHTMVLVDTIIHIVMDTGAERRENLKLKLLLKLRLIPGYTMDMDVDLHTMVLVDTIVLTDIYGVERRGKLKLLLKLQLLLILMLRLIPGMDTMDIDTMVILMLDTTWVNEDKTAIFVNTCTC